ncbi:FAD-dependent monooxygenase [Sphingomonas sp. PP-CC-3A-396]|uniref:FAD-dependent monooxygenase n=1 Tax=Sphingomonas sp. PP-CC-3A-396 TaxID=2135655 RepID=UPI00104DCEC2|nr:FAD-dependent monooxygenase [Sphingomonas sp. PP-CC-3A-396]TCQ06538.1 2-polyprenyl-6-methoxyphenol hydroxylase-like FAD-dependent oxidoreductase [Sphingomonas sp. PP-CC-3A-396]
MQSASGEILIVGAGIAGLAVARALQERSVPFSVVERRLVPTDGGLAIVLPGNAMQALATLGLREQIEAIGHPIGRRQYRAANDRLLCEIDEDAFWGPTCRPCCVRRSALLAMLADGLPHHSVWHDAGVAAMVSHARHAEVTLTNGASLSARLVVGADGVHSTIRAQTFVGQSGVTGALMAQSSWRFMAPNPGVDCWSLWTGADGMVLLVPVDGDAVYGWVATTRPHPAGSPTNPIARMEHGFPERVRRALRHALSQEGSLYHSPMEEVRLPTWHRGRAVLVGDAAHATAPVWAQGAALALEDAIVLARSVGEHLDIATALSDYQHQRWKRVAHVQRLTDAMSRAAKLPNLIRNALLPVIGPRRYRQTYEPLKVQV